MRLIPGRRMVIVTPAGRAGSPGAGADVGHDRPAHGPAPDPRSAPGPGRRAGRSGASRSRASAWSARGPRSKQGGTHAGFAVGEAAARRRPSAPPLRRRRRPRRAAVLDGTTAAMDELFRTMVGMKGSDLHISVGSPPMVRHDGEIRIAARSARVLSAGRHGALLWPIAPERNREEFERRHDTDFAYEIAGVARFRCNVFVDRKGMGGVFRLIPSKIMTAEEMGLSQGDPELCHLPKGLVLVTGPDRLRQVDDALRAHRLHQPQPHRPHHHDRGPDRVRAREQEVPDQPAPGRRAHRLVQGRAARRAARGSGHRAGRRDARPGDDRHRHRDGGDGPPRVRHAAHHVGAVARWTASSTSSPPTGRSRSASCSPRASRASSRRCSARRSAAGASPRCEILIGTPSVANLIREGEDVPDPVDHADGQEVRHVPDERELHRARRRRRSSSRRRPTPRPSTSRAS